MLVEDHNLFENVADIVQSETINIEHVARTIISLINILNNAANNVLPLINNLDSYFISKTIKNYLLVKDNPSFSKGLDIIQLQQDRIIKISDFFSEDIIQIDDTITENNYDLIDAKVNLPVNDSVHYADIFHVPSLKEILVMKDIDLIKPQNSMRLPTDREDRHPLEEQFFEYTRFAEEIAEMNKKSQVKDIEAYCYLFLNEMIRNLTILFQNIFRVVLEYYASLDISYYREINCTLFLQALSGSLTPSERIRILHAKESVLSCYEELVQKIWVLRGAFPLFDSAYKKLGLEKHLTTSRDYRDFLKNDLISRHQVTIHISSEQLKIINSFLLDTFSKGDWSDLSDGRKLAMLKIIGITNNFIYDVSPIIENIVKINEFYIQSCLNIQKFAKDLIEIKSNGKVVVQLSQPYPMKVSHTDVEEKILDELEKLLLTPSAPNLITRQLTLIAKKYLNNIANHFLKQMLENKYHEKELLKFLSLYLCRQRLSERLFNKVFTAHNQKNDLSLENVDLSKISEIEFIAISSYISYAAKYLSLENCDLLSCQESRLRILFSSIGKSNLAYLSLKNNQLGKLNTTLLEEIRQQLRNTQILRLDVSDNELCETELDRLHAIVESNLLRWFLSSKRLGLKYIVSRFMWNNLGTTVDANQIFANKLLSSHKTKMHKSYLINQLEEQNRFGLKF